MDVVGYLFGATYGLAILSIGSLILSGIVALVAAAADGARNYQNQGDLDPKRVRRYFVGSFLGALAASIMTVAATVTSLWWFCAKVSERYCHDGQGGIQLVVTVPIAWVFGAFAGILWTGFAARIRARCADASKFPFPRLSPLWNGILEWIIPTVFWLILGVGLFRLMIVS